MKRFIKNILLIALTFASLLSCKKEEKVDLSKEIIGEWELNTAQLATKAVSIGSEDVTVYIEFLSNGSFFLSQKLGQGRYVKFDGTWTITDNILSGKYSDGSMWASDYSVTITDRTLTLALASTPSEVYAYIRSSIPKEAR